MRLPAYDVTIVISNPEDKSCEYKITLEKVSREKLIEKPIPLKGSLEEFERLVEDPAIKRMTGRL